MSLKRSRTSPDTTTSSSGSSNSNNNPNPPSRRGTSPGAPAPSHFKREHDEKLIQLALHKNPFFTCLDEEQIERFVAAAELKVFQPGEIVILEGCVDRDIDHDENGNVTGRDAIQPASGGGDDDDENVVVEGDRSMDDDDSRESTVADSSDREAQRHGRMVVTEGPADADEALVEIDAEPSRAVSPSSSDRRSDDLQYPSLPSERDNQVTDAADGLSDEETLTAEGKGLDDDELEQNDDSQEDVEDTASIIAAHDSQEEESKVVGDVEDDSLLQPPPPQSQVKRSIYIVRSGHADVWYQRFNPASLGPGTVFGEGGFLFNRQHSASVVASRTEPLECWVVDFPTFAQHVLPSNNMSRLFHQHAHKQDETGQYYMTMNDFVTAIAHQEAHSPSPTPLASLDPLVSLRIANTYNIFHNPPDSSSSSKNRIYLSDFCFFYLLMARPDPEVDIAFLLMDQRRTGQIHLHDLIKFVTPLDPQLNWNSDFFRRYFGTTDSGSSACSIRQADFSQFLIDLQREMGQQAFLRAVQHRGINGYLNPTDFVQVLQKSCGWRLPQGVSDRLESMYCHSPTQAGEATAVVAVRAGTLKGASVKEVVQSTEASVLADMEQREKNLGLRYFAYGDFVAFQEVLAMLPGICNLIDRGQEIKQGPVSPDDFKVANRVLGLGGRLSRRQVDIIFALFDLDRDGFVSHEDTVSVCGVDFAQRLVAVRGRNGLLTFAPPPEYKPTDSASLTEGTVQVVSRVQLFSLTALAGALGVVALSPLELIKTRLMNQRILMDGRGRLYHNSLDCFRQVLRTEGLFGLYRGLTPQLLGVAPEKAIKLQVNQLLRQVFTTEEDGSPPRTLNLPLEVVAGAGAGACQLLVTNPMEIVKTRLILQGETTQLLLQKGLTPPPSQTLRGVIRDLGFPGVYRGALACLLRDIPFSAIYFPAYAICKNALADRHDVASGMHHKASLSDLLLAGTLAGVPAALLTTPCDVIRLRLQAIPRPGDVMYASIQDCATKIYEREGWAGFFRGAAARVLRIAPQFGISLLAYEQITQGFGFEYAASPPTNAPVDPRDYRTAFPAAALRPKTDDIDSWMRHFGVSPPSSIRSDNNEDRRTPGKSPSSPRDR